MYTLMVEGQEDVTADDFLALGTLAEDLGFDGFATSDHYDSVVGAPGRGSLDVWGLICALAAATERIRIGTMVSPVTFRPPAVLAKLALAADGLSRGRIEVGLGTGWHDVEHQRFGLPFPPFADRLAMLTEQVEIIRRLTDGETLDFDGSHYQLRGATLLPRPVTGRMRIVFGGSAKPKVAALAARFADAYNVVWISPEDAREARGRLDQACEAIGRDPATLPMTLMARFVVGSDEADYRRRLARVTAKALEGDDEDPSPWIAGTCAQVIERIATYRAHGVEGFYLNHFDHRDLDMVRLCAADVLPHVR